MGSLPQRICNRLIVSAGRLRYECFSTALTERAVRKRLDPVLARELPKGSSFWRALYEAFLEACPPRVRLLDPASFEQKNATARRVADGGIRVLGRELSLPSGYDWNRDLFFDVQWERKYYRALSDRRAGSDLVLLWMPNRMLHLLKLSGAYAVTGEESYAAAWRDQAVSWCRYNPYCVGMNWRSPLEIGIRLFVFNMGLQELAGSRALDSTALAPVLQSILRQGEHLASRFSYWDGNANNHLIGEAATLHAHASMWKPLRRSSEWRELGRTVFEREIERQVLSDGVSFENSVNYHVQVLDFVLLHLLFRHLAGEPSGERIAAAAGRMAAAYCTLLSPRGRLPRFGDDTAREHLILKDSDAVEKDGSGDPVRFDGLVKPEYRTVLKDASGAAHVVETSVPLKIERLLPASGFAILRSPDSHLACFAGIVHDGSFHGGHLHADPGTFELELGGRMIFIDSGTYLYTCDPRYRDHFKGTRAHNTLLVDGRELMESGNTFSWKTIRKARSLQLAVESNAAAVWSRHPVDGRAGARFIHTRMLIRTGTGAWLIVDQVGPEAERCCGESGEHTHEAEIFFHTPFERLRAGAAGAVEFDAGEDISGGRAHSGRGANRPARVRLYGTASAEYRRRIVTGRDDLLAAYSPRYGELRYGGTIAVASSFAGSVALCHVLHAATGTDWPPPAIECESDGVMVRLPESGDEWQCAFQPVRIWRNGELLHQERTAGPKPGDGSDG